MSVTAIRAPGNGRGTDIGIERRPVRGEARRSRLTMLLELSHRTETCVRHAPRSKERVIDFDEAC